MFIDIHCHILPGIDDGAKNVEASLEMAREAVSQGISHILCTPHHINGTYINPKKDVIGHVAELQQVLDSEDIPLTLYEGQEVRLSGDLIKRIAENDILFTDLEDTYLLIEFPSMEIPAYAEQALFELITNGYRPIIVHPERNAHVIHNPDVLIPFIKMGCLSQVTCGSYVGQFGKDIQKVSKKLIEQNLAHVIASDAHNTKYRGFYMAEAYAKLEKEFGEEKRQHFEQTVKDVINGDRVKLLPITESKKKFSLFG
ncbi:MAG: tyrosine-protein phosphatase [Vagococcus sp.]